MERIVLIKGKVETKTTRPRSDSSRQNISTYFLLFFRRLRVVLILKEDYEVGGNRPTEVLWWTLPNWVGTRNIPHSQWSNSRTPWHKVHSTIINNLCRMSFYNCIFFFRILLTVYENRNPTSSESLYILTRFYTSNLFMGTDAETADDRGINMTYYSEKSETLNFEGWTRMV